MKCPGFERYKLVLFFWRSIFGNTYTFKYVWYIRKNPKVLKNPLVQEFQEFIYKDFVRKFTVLLFKIANNCKKPKFLHIGHLFKVDISLWRNTFKYFYTYTYVCFFIRTSLVPQLVKNPPAMQETWVQSLGWEHPLEKGKATHFGILAWRIPWTV